MRVRHLLLVDDHPLIRHGMARVLSSAIPHVTIAEAADAEGALEAFRARKWDLVTLDLTMPGTDGLDLLLRIKAAAPDVPVLVVSMHEVELFAARAVDAGAAGYLTKSSDPHQLVEAVHALLEHGRWSPGKPANARPAGPPPHDALSDREYQVLRMLGQGMTVSEIAATLSLSVKTVSTYRARILEKLHLRTTAEIMHYAISRRLT